MLEQIIKSIQIMNLDDWMPQKSAVNSELA